MSSCVTGNGNLVRLRSRSRAPIIWIIFPLIAGFVTGRKIFLSEFLLIGVGIGLGVVWGLFWWRESGQWYWKIIGVMSVYFLSWGYLQSYLPVSLNWEEKPEREAYLTLKIGQVFGFDEKYNRQVGYGEIVGAGQHLRDLVGQKIYFSCILDEIYPPSGALIRSEVIEVKGVLRSIGKETENGFEKYLFSQGIRFKLYRGKLLNVQEKANWFYRFCAEQNKKLEKILAMAEETDNVHALNIYKAMLLGKQADLTAQQKYAFSITGSLHLFSISGLHVGVIAGCVAFLLRLVRVRNPWAAIIGIVILFLYVQITGGSAPAMRAFFMVVFYWVGRAFQRKNSAFSALLASAFVALIYNPFDLWNIGFQLSYMVVGSILLYGLPLNEVINDAISKRFVGVPVMIKKGCVWVVNLLGVSVAANVGATFLSICYFNIFAPGSIFLSILIIPLASLIISFGFTALFMGLVGLTFICEAINPISYMGIRMMELIISFSLKIPGLFWGSCMASQSLTYICMSVLFAFLYGCHRFNQLQKILFYLAPIGMITIFVSFS